MKQILLLLGLLAVAAALYVGGMIVMGAITRFRPAPVEPLTTVPANAGTAPQALTDTTFTFLIWNVGYGGLGKEADFFYDGGKMVTSPEPYVKKNIDGISDFLTQNKDVDFLMLQEVDRDSKRSYHVDEVSRFAQALPKHNYTFATNYKIVYLPFPFTNPMGKVFSGLQTFSKFSPMESRRIALPGITDFPRKLFYLERCLLEQRYKLASGKELIIINTHFEAYDDGSVKKEQMALTKKILEQEYAKGNYVVIGGDWNIAPPSFNVHQWEKVKETEQLYLMNNDADYVPGWHYHYDPETPTNRKNDHAYDPATTFTTIIDYFFTSPNIEVDEVKGVNLGFAYSDHNPVKMRMRLK